jgi:hypothetical protein
MAEANKQIASTLGGVVGTDAVLGCQGNNYQTTYLTYLGIRREAWVWMGVEHAGYRSVYTRELASTTRLRNEGMHGLVAHFIA